MLNVAKKKSSQINVINTGDDVDMSSTQLSKSIDKRHDDDSWRLRRSSFTSILKFPRCQTGINTNENLTFPLCSKRIPLNNHYKNISMHDLLKNLQERLRGDGPKGNYKLSLASMGKDNDRGKCFIRNQCTFDRIERNFNWWPNYNLKGKFPVKLQQKVLSKVFPCHSEEVAKEIESLIKFSRKSFPSKRKLVEGKFPCRYKKPQHQSSECAKIYGNTQDFDVLKAENLSEIIGYQILAEHTGDYVQKQTFAEISCYQNLLHYDNMNILQFLHLESENLKRTSEYLRDLKHYVLGKESGLKELSPFYLQWLRFPAKADNDHEITLRFPCLVLQQEGDILENFSEQAENTSCSDSTEAGNEKIKSEINTNLKELESCGTDLTKSKIEKIETEIKTKLQEVDNSKDNSTEVETKKLSQETKISQNSGIFKQQKDFNEENFPKPVILEFPFNTELTTTKFPLLTTRTEVLLKNLTVKEIRQKFQSNRIKKSLETSMNLGDNKPYSGRKGTVEFKKFPLMNFNNEVNFTTSTKEQILKFPSITTESKYLSRNLKKMEAYDSFKYCRFTHKDLDLFSRNLYQPEISRYPSQSKFKGSPSQSGFNRYNNQQQFKCCPDQSEYKSYFNQPPAIRFPVNYQDNETQFPLKSLCHKEFILNLNVLEISLKFKINKISKSVKSSQGSNSVTRKDCVAQQNLKRKFPLKYSALYHDKATKFPVNSSETLTNFKPSKPSLKFPLQLDPNPRKFPSVRSPRKTVVDNLIISIVKRQFHINQISKSLQSPSNGQPLAKIFTRFPLKTRLIKKFYRIFPSEMDIPKPQYAAWNRKKQQQSTAMNHGQHCNLENFSINPTPLNIVNSFESSKTPPISNKQQCLLCQKLHTADVNENHASQVQIIPQVHVENPVETSSTPSTTPVPSSNKHNDHDEDMNVLPTINTKNIPLTTTKTVTLEVGQQTENFEHHDAIINFRENVDEADVVSSFLLSQNIINSSSNEVECERRAADTLRASTPPSMSTTAGITSVRNAESNVVHGDLDGHDLCNPQVAQNVECSSDVRDTFNTTVDNGGQIKENLSSTGSILASHQSESSSSIPSSPATPSPLNTLRSTQTSSPSLPPSVPSLSSTVAAVVRNRSDHKCSTSLEDNYPLSIELLPKYSVLELGACNAINCPEIDCIEIIGVNAENLENNTDEVSNEIAEKLVEVNENLKSNENCDNCEGCKSCENRENFRDESAILASEEIDEKLSVKDLLFFNDLSVIDEMKLEMKNSKSALPSTTTASARSVGKLGNSAPPFNNAIPNATSPNLRSDKDRMSSTVASPTSSLSRPNIVGTRKLSNGINANTTNTLSSSLRKSGDRIGSTATRRLSNDYSSGPAYSTSPRTSTIASTNSVAQRTPYQRTSTSSNYGNDTTTKTPSLTANRYTADTTTSSTAPTTATGPSSNLIYTRRPTSALPLSVDLTTNSPSGTSASLGRTVPLDTSSNLGILPERSRLRRQRRFRSQGSQDEDEDPIHRLNRLKARISASLSEVKGVLKQYSTEGEGDGEQSSVKPLAQSCHPAQSSLPAESTPPAQSSLVSLRKVKEENDAEAEQKDGGPILFRFVKKVRRRSFYSEDDEENDTVQAKGEDVVDKSQANENKEASPLQLPQQEGAAATTKESNQISLKDLDVTAVNDREKSPQRSFTTEYDVKAFIKTEDTEKLKQALTPTDLKITENQTHFKVDHNNQQQTTKDETVKRENIKHQVSPQQPETEIEKPLGTNKLEDIEANDTNTEIKVNNAKSNEVQIKSLPQTDQKSENKDISQIEDINDNKVSGKSEESPKKEQNPKAKKCNKAEPKQRESRLGKATSKIPQKVEIKSGNKWTETEKNNKSSQPKKSATKSQNHDKANESDSGENKVDGKVVEPSTKSLIAEIKKTENHFKVNESKESEIRKGTYDKETTSKTLITPIAQVKVTENGNKETKHPSPHVLTGGNNATSALEPNKTEKDQEFNRVLIPAAVSGNAKQEMQAFKKSEIVNNVNAQEISPKLVTNEVKANQKLAERADENQNEVECKDILVKATKQTTENKSNDQAKTSTTAEVPQKPLIKIEAVAVQTTNSLSVNNNNVSVTETNRSGKDTFNGTPIMTKKRVLTKVKDPSRRASLAAVEGSKIEPPVHMVTPRAIERRPSDSEAIVKKKLITTKTTISGSIGEVTPKPKFVKVKRSSIKKPPSPPIASDHHTRHQMATTQQQQQQTPAIATNKRTDQRNEEAASPSSEANKSFQGDHDKDVTMPTDEIVTQLPQSHGQIDRTQLVSDEAAKRRPTSPSSLSLVKKTIDNDSSSSTLRTTIDKSPTTTTNLAAGKFENNAGGDILANVKPTLVSSTTTSEAIAANRQTSEIPPHEDLYDLLQQEAVIVAHKPVAHNNRNELKASESSTGGTHITPVASDEKSNEPLDILQQQVVKTTDIVSVKPKEPSIGLEKATTAPATSATVTASSAPSAAAYTSSLVARNQHQQQQHDTPSTLTTTTTTTSEDATTKTNDAPQISISSQEATTKDTTETATLPSLTKQFSASSNLSTTGGLTEYSENMPELQLAPAPVQTADIPHDHEHGPLKQKVIKKIIHPKSTVKAQTAAHQSQPSEELTAELSEVPQSEVIEEVLQDDTATASASEEYSESTEQSAEESPSQAEAAAAVTKPPKIRTVKKKVIIKRQKRKLSVSDPFFNHVAAEEPISVEVETLEKPIAYVSDEESDEEQVEEPVIEEKKPLKSCLNKKEYQIGDQVLYAERFKKTQIRWKRGRVKERITSISYLIDIDGKDVSSHINYLKKYTGRKVNFGAKEYLEIDYEQLEEDEERAEKVKQRSSSIWNMV